MAGNMISPVAYAVQQSASDNLKIRGERSPLGLAAARFFPSITSAKYDEIGNYPTQIVGRATRLL